MLDKKSRKVLKVLNRIKNEDDYVDGLKVLIPLMPKKYTEKVLFDVLWHLNELNLIACSEAECTINEIYVTYEGQNYTEFQWIELKAFIKKSILTPIAVSFITSLITIFLTNIFSKK